MPSVAELLSAARNRLFVGRDYETDTFESLLMAEQPDCVLLYLYGPGGQGKSTLLKHLKDRCANKGIGHIWLDAREIEPHPAAFQEAVRTALNRTDAAARQRDVADLLGDIQGRTVLFIDTYEKISPIDDWVRLAFLPQLPAKVLTVISGRNAPSLAWMTDAGWKALMRTVQLRNFSTSETEDYLQRRNIPRDKFSAIINFTHGHPLALSVVADIYQQFPDKDFSPDESPNVMHTLLQLFVQQVPSPMHRAALEVCALVNILTESLLAEVMMLPDASELFNWMCGLSFVSIGKEGIYPHDITREALCANMRWRHPDWNAELHMRCRKFYHRKLKETAGEAQRKVLFDLLFLHRLNPVVRPFFDWQEAGSFWVDSANVNDLPAIRSMIEQHEGTESLAAFDFWSKNPAAQVWVWRDGTRTANAFVLKINAHELQADKTMPDAAMRKLLDYQQKNLHLRQGEQTAVFRMWMAKDTHQGVSALQSSIFLTIVQYYFTPALAVSFLNVVQPEFWKAGFSYADLTHVGELDFSTQGQPFGFYMHDWRARPPLAWLDLLGKREVGSSSDFDDESSSKQVVVLSETEFADSMSEALRNFHNNAQLLHNPLLRAKITVQNAGVSATDNDLLQLLKEKILATIKDIEDSPLDGKYHRVLYRTYINPVGSQEKTADFLNMSFSTYRRYLVAGTQRVSELLWQEELR